MGGKHPLSLSPTLRFLAVIMKIMSCNIQGFGKDDESDSKIGWFRKLRIREKPDVVAIQESKCNLVNDSWIECIWGSSDFNYIQKPKIGKSGGMLLIWLMMQLKSLDELMQYDDVDWVFGGDFNEVRSQDERQNCNFIQRRANLFNEFIEKNHLFEASLVGKLFTRISDDGKKLSKLDRFIVSEHKEIEPIIINAWKKDVTGTRPDCLFRDKLKNIKDALRSWSKHRYGTIDIDLESWKNITEAFECKADAGVLSDSERDEWINARSNWLKKEKEKTGMLRQKAKLKWAAEGDDNTAFFHSTIRRGYN
ncbi:uncharacterized protein [Rutidosis leptorrhynchoides]|uniref:uncharacterized protein n=1 Tax=Rutidosis leptorrhynchoides TaxID=125765 RepID=UPI003A99915E